MIFLELLLIFMWPIIFLIGFTFVVWYDTQDFKKEGSYRTVLRWPFLAVFIGGLAYHFEWLAGNISKEHFVNIGWYLLIGLGYSVFEFVATIFSARIFWRNFWVKFLEKYGKGDLPKGVTLGDTDENPLVRSLDFHTRRYVVGEITLLQLQHIKFQAHYPGKMFGFIGITSDDSGELKPWFDNVRIAQYAADWTIFWPCFLINTVLGNFWSWIGQTLTAIFKPMVNRIFRGVFN